MRAVTCPSPNVVPIRARAKISASSFARPEDALNEPYRWVVDRSQAACEFRSIHRIDVSLDLQIQAATSAFPWKCGAQPPTARESRGTGLQFVEPHGERPSMNQLAPPASPCTDNQPNTRNRKRWGRPPLAVSSRVSILTALPPVRISGRACLTRLAGAFFQAPQPGTVKLHRRHARWETMPVVVLVGSRNIIDLSGANPSWRRPLPPR